MKKDEIVAYIPITDRITDIKKDIVFLDIVSELERMLAETIVKEKLVLSSYIIYIEEGDGFSKVGFKAEVLKECDEDFYTEALCMLLKAGVKSKFVKITFSNIDNPRYQ